MTFEEFKKTIFYTRTKMVIPVPIDIRINKTDFFRKGIYNFKLQDEYLNQIYIKYNIEKL